jgi:hypothetical protein
MQASDVLELAVRTASDTDDERQKSVKQMKVSFLRSCHAAQRAYLNKI